MTFKCVRFWDPVAIVSSLWFWACVCNASYELFSPWPKFRGGNENLNRGLSTYAGPTSVSTYFTKATSGLIFGSPAITSNGANVVFASEDGGVYSLFANGTLAWLFYTPYAFESTPAISGSGNIYIGDNGHYLYCIMPSRPPRLVWSFQGLGAFESSPAIGPDTTVYAGNDDHYLYALDGTKGTLKWSFLTGGIVFSSPAISSDGNVIIASADFSLYSLNGATGKQNWKYTTGGAIYSSPTLSSTGTTYNIFFGSFDFNVYCLDQAGNLVWKYAATNNIFASVAFDPYVSRVYIGAYDRFIYALDANTGSLIWTYATAGGITSSVAIDANSNVYVGSTDYYLYALTASGTVLWTSNLGGYIYSSPAISSDGSIYCGSANKFMYALHSALPTSQPTSNPSARPTTPSSQPTSRPTRPTGHPSRQPTGQPTRQPSRQPNARPTSSPSRQPSVQPTGQPTRQPSHQPSAVPSRQPTNQPTMHPSAQPSKQPNSRPSHCPSAQPSLQPTVRPTRQPSSRPSIVPSSQPSRQPTRQPTKSPRAAPTCQPVAVPSSSPTAQPSFQPLLRPTARPSSVPSSLPSRPPSSHPTSSPSRSNIYVENVGVGVGLISNSSSRSSSNSKNNNSNNNMVRQRRKGVVVEAVLAQIQAANALPSASFSSPAEAAAAMEAATKRPARRSLLANKGTHTFANLGYERAVQEELYLSLSVAGTGFGPAASQFVSLFVNGYELDNSIAKPCAPGQTCFAGFYHCWFNVPVSSYLSPSQGGSLQIDVVVSGVTTSSCPYNLIQQHGGSTSISTYLVYANLTLSQGEAQATPSPSLSPTTAPLGANVDSADALSGLLVTNGLVVVALISVLFLVGGVFLVRIRGSPKSGSKVVRLSLKVAMTNIFLLGAMFVSEMFTIDIMLSDSNSSSVSSNEVGHTRAIAYTMLVARMLNAVPSLYLLHQIYAPSLFTTSAPSSSNANDNDNENDSATIGTTSRPTSTRSVSLAHLPPAHGLAALLDQGKLIKYSRVYIALCILSLIDVPFLRYLPWRVSPFANISSGFPNLHTYSIISISKLLQSLTTFACSVAFVALTNREHGGADRGNGGFSSALFYVNIVSSVLNILINAFDYVCKSAVLVHSSVAGEDVYADAAALASSYGGSFAQSRPSMPASFASSTSFGRGQGIEGIEDQSVVTQRNPMLSLANVRTGVSSLLDPIPDESSNSNNDGISMVNFSSRSRDTSTFGPNAVDRSSSSNLDQQAYMTSLHAELKASIRSDMGVIENRLEQKIQRLSMQVLASAAAARVTLRSGGRNSSGAAGGELQGEGEGEHV